MSQVLLCRLLHSNRTCLDAQFATLHSQLLKREDELRDLKDTLDDTVTKVRNPFDMFLVFLIPYEQLRQEADRALKLEATLKQRTHELQNERTTRQNVEVALASTQRKLKKSSSKRPSFGVPRPVTGSQPSMAANRLDPEFGFGTGLVPRGICDAYCA